MTKSKSIRRSLVAGIGILIISASTAGCTTATNVAENIELYGHNITYNSDLADRVPADWKKGVTAPIQVLRPNAFVDENGNEVGMQPDLLKAISTKLGINIDLEVAPFDAQVPGVQSSQYAFTTATGDFPERQKVLTMVDYTVAGVGWLARKDSPIKSETEVCGLTIGVAKGTAQEQFVEDVIKDCEDRGISGTTAVGFSNTLMTVPLEAERIDVAYDSISSVLYFAEAEPEKFKKIGGTSGVSSIALGVPAGEQEKAELLRDTVQELMDEGVYASIFEEWGLEDLKLDAAYINLEGLNLE